MVNVAEKQRNKDLFPVWNPEFVVTKDKNIGSNMLRFPVQNLKLLSFKHFKGLTMFNIMLNLDRIDSWRIHKYCDGTNTVKQICEIIISQYPEVTESAVMEKIEKMARMSIITLI